MLNYRTKEEHNDGNERNTEIRIQSKGRTQKVCQIHTNHEHFAMTEVNDLHDAEDNILSHSHE